MNRRTALTLQLLFALLALAGIGLTVWAIYAFSQEWSFETSARSLQDLLGPATNGSLNELFESRPGRVVAMILPDQSGQATAWSIYLPLITTIVSILGFLATTWLAWRKERRESARESLELERLRLEVEALKRQMARAPLVGETNDRLPTDEVN